MQPADYVWGGLLVAGIAFETYALRNGRDEDTLSEATRRLFRVRSKPGKVIFFTAWVAFSAWYLIHIVF